MSKIQKIGFPALLFVCLMLKFGLMQADLPPTINEQEKLFLQAEEALAADNTAEFNRLKKKLSDYPLYPYLIYDALQANLTDLSAKQVDEFLHQYSDTPLQSDLRYSWLKLLAKQEKWPDYVRYYQPTKNIQLQCHYAEALLRTGQQQKAYALIEKLWLSPYSRPQSCDYALDRWVKAELNAKQVWQRIEMAINRGNVSLATYLKQFLSIHDRKSVDLWLRVRKNPSLVFAQKHFRTKSSVDLRIIVYGVMRHASQNPDAARKMWLSIEGRYPFSTWQKQRVIRKIAVNLASRHLLQAQAWLSKISRKYRDQATRDWQIRNALWQQEWPHVINLISQLPEKESASNIWQYWRARALEATGKKQAAKSVYQKLAKHNTYYGVLSHWRLGTKVAFQRKAVAIEAEVIEQVEVIPAIERARELYRLDRYEQARSEWSFGTKNLNKIQLRAAAIIASDWGWHDRGIKSAAQAGPELDFKISYPFGFTNEVYQAAKKYGLNPAWLYAVIRQESLFMSDAGSHVGAQGLMQLMPATARFIASAAEVDLSPDLALLESDKNIRLGAHYLRMMIDQFQGNSILATAAYNAGPGNVRKWLPKKPIPADIWIENIPFSETRGYEKNVLKNLLIYSTLLNQGNNFKNRLALIPSTSDLAKK